MSDSEDITNLFSSLSTRGIDCVYLHAISDALDHSLTPVAIADITGQTLPVSGRSHML